jgi:hypothetical protein
MSRGGVMSAKDRMRQECNMDIKNFMSPDEACIYSNLSLDQLGEFFVSGDLEIYIRTAELEVLLACNRLKENPGRLMALINRELLKRTPD